jgi:hypothetical protein
LEFKLIFSSFDALIVGWSLGLKQKVVQNGLGKLKRGCGIGADKLSKT